MRRLLAAAGGAGSYALPERIGLINACPTSSYQYVIGPISSSDGGLTYAAGSGSVIGTQTGWASTYIKDPTMIWDGSQFVILACGWNGSNFQVGKFTAKSWSDILAGTITPDPGNPIFGVPNDGSWRQSGALFPMLHYVPGDATPYKLWMTGSDAGTFTEGFLDSDDGDSWSDHGQVIGLGGAGSFRDEGVWSGPAIKVGSTWYVTFGGRHNATHYTRSAYCTTNDPTDANAYSAPVQYANLASDLTVGGKTWHSNQPHYITDRGGLYEVGLDVWYPTSGGEEACSVITTDDLTSLPVPSGLMIPIDDGSWHANSAENPTVIVAP